MLISATYEELHGKNQSHQTNPDSSKKATAFPIQVFAKHESASSIKEVQKITKSQNLHS